MNTRRFAVRAVGALAVAAATATGSAGIAAAAPQPAQAVWTYSPAMLVLGQNALCSGTIDVAYDTDTTRPGVVGVTLTSRGMRGLDPDWSRNPVCHVEATITTTSGLFDVRYQEVELFAGTHPGDSVRTEVFTGSGIKAMSVGVTYANPTWTELRPQFGTPASAYVNVP